MALRIISRRLTEREPKALVITLIDSSPELLVLLLPSGGQKQIYTHSIYIHKVFYLYIYTRTYTYIHKTIVLKIEKGNSLCTASKSYTKKWKSMHIMI